MTNQTAAQPAETDALREALADVSHEIWSHWMRYMFTQVDWLPDGSCTIPASKVERWAGQMNKAYAYLTEREKDSDREQADKILAVLGEQITMALQSNEPTSTDVLAVAYRAWKEQQR